MEKHLAPRVALAQRLPHPAAARRGRYHPRMFVWLDLSGITLAAAVLLGAAATFAAPATIRGHLLIVLAALAASLTLGLTVVALAD